VSALPSCFHAAGFSSSSSCWVKVPVRSLPSLVLDFLRACRARLARPQICDVFSLRRSRWPDLFYFVLGFFAAGRSSGSRSPFSWCALFSALDFSSGVSALLSARFPSAATAARCRFSRCARIAAVAGVLLSRRCFSCSLRSRCSRVQRARSDLLGSVFTSTRISSARVAPRV
jgi:hypothetical protein